MWRVYDNKLKFLSQKQNSGKSSGMEIGVSLNVCITRGFPTSLYEH